MREPFTVWHEYKGYRFAYGDKSAQYWWIKRPDGSNYFLFNASGQKAVREWIDTQTESAR